MNEENNPIKTEDAKNEDKVNEVVQKVLNTEDTTSEYSKEDIEKNKVMAVLSYIGILVLIPYFGAKESKFVQFHAKQGLNLFILEVVGSIAISIVSTIFYAIAYGLGTLVSVVSFVFSLCVFALSIMGIVNVFQGKAKGLPIIEKIKIIK